MLINYLKDETATDNRDNPSYSTINKMTYIKYLGLMFDYNMRWYMHVLNITTRLKTITCLINYIAYIK